MHSLAICQLCDTHYLLSMSLEYLGINYQARYGMTCSISAHVKCEPRVPSNCSGGTTYLGPKQHVSITLSGPPFS
ncbi:hypothetical protein VP01_745g6 [Puccinia sorghi]|uniref:Phorbol-ester/DAG-type domain-containing protein n=1 Tax=Puccinia sorghi TaxID=27349 RepID=A0A0L6UEK1_9BASI|nr:hypothetical protein VP01_745g6 [Puccinia sorghi]